MKNYAYLHASDPQEIETLYHSYQNNPSNIDPSWAMFFQGFDFGIQKDTAVTTTEELKKEIAVFELIMHLRSWGHLYAQTNSLEEKKEELKIEKFGLETADLNKNFAIATHLGFSGDLGAVFNALQKKYCGSIGFEFNHTSIELEKNWWQEKIEKEGIQISLEQEKNALYKLIEAIELEKFFNKKFVGQKRFSIEGTESFLPLMQQIIDLAATQNSSEIILGMAHRGRINSLINLVKKPASLLFSEFEGKLYDDRKNFDGDVKYHLGYSNSLATFDGKKIQMTLCPNPSHLETVNPVVLGLTRAKIDQNGGDTKKIIPILVHGDAALAGQGVVYEIAQMNALKGYQVGGTIHIAINNQVGFTTDFKDSRSATYCTDIAKLTGVPVLHVNADDVVAVLQAAIWALDYRQKFGKDVYIDLIGFRKYGHNEGDEPRFTQPKMYAKIDARKYTKELYQNQLLNTQKISTEEIEAFTKKYLAQLEEAYEKAKKQEKVKITPFLSEYQKFEFADAEKILSPVDTKVKKEDLEKIAQALVSLSTDKKYFKKSKKILEDRAKMIENNQLDWGLGELLAYGSLLQEGASLRMSGQDIERGTFSHRHAVITTEDKEEKIMPLDGIKAKNAQIHIYNSLLSEYGVLGFEWGYALANPQGLTIWEAQFGDFSNGAQIVIDQYLSAAEDKWNVQNSLVLLLPHGFEGQGSEHSSARMERFLQLCGDDNMQIVNCTTPANFFHVLRRQVKATYRKPLVVFTPKQLLRHPLAVSKMEDLSEGSFQPMIVQENSNKNIQKIVFCTGKIYYELLDAQSKKNKMDILLIRLEQLFPLPIDQIQKMIAQYPKAQCIWVQEEPQNMGAWNYILYQLHKIIPTISCISRPASASPAPGSHALDHQLQKQIQEALFQ